MNIINEIKQVLSGILYIAIVFFIEYLIFAFIMAEANFKLWPIPVRITLVILVIVSLISLWKMGQKTP